MPWAFRSWWQNWAGELRRTCLVRSIKIFVRLVIIVSLILHIPGTPRMSLEGSIYVFNVGQSWEVEAVLMVDSSFKKYVGGFVICVSVSNICMCISVSVWVVQSWMDVCAYVYLYIDIVVCVCVYFHVCVSVFVCVYMYVFQCVHRQVWIAQRWSKC